MEAAAPSAAAPTHQAVATDAQPGEAQPTDAQPRANLEWEGDEKTVAPVEEAPAPGPPSFPRFLKRDLRAWAPGGAYAQGDELRRNGEVSHVSLIGVTLAGRVQGKNVLVHTGADGSMVGKCSICRAWTSPELGPAAPPQRVVPPAALEDAPPPASAAAAGGGRTCRGVSMCGHTIALLLEFLGQKQTLTAAAQPALFTQLRTLGPERLIALVGVVAGRNPALLGRLQSYVCLVRDDPANKGPYRGEEFLARAGFHDPSAPLPLSGGDSGKAAAAPGAEAAKAAAKPAQAAAAFPESIFQRKLARALREYAQASYSTGNAVQRRQDAYRSSVGPLLESRFEEIRAVAAPALSAAQWTGERGNPLQQLVPLAGEIFAACRSASITAWQTPHHADAMATVTKIEEFVVERLLRWAWKPITSDGVGGLRPDCALSFEVTSAQRRAWLAAVERTPSTLLWPALLCLHEPIQCGSGRRAAVETVVKATAACGDADPSPTLFAERLPGLVGVQLELLREWKSYGEAFGLCHGAGRPIEACLSLVEATVRHRTARDGAARDTGGSGAVAVELKLLDQVVEYVEQHQDAVRKQCKDSEETRVLDLLRMLEKVSVEHCYKACVAGERYALAADCLQSSAEPDGQDLLTDLLIAHPEMLRNPQDAERYIAALQRGAPADAAKDNASAKLLRVYAAAASGLSGQDEYWGGRCGHIDMPAWLLVQELARGDGSSLLDKHVASVLQLFARTALTEEQFKAKLHELRGEIYCDGRWARVARPALKKLCEPTDGQAPLLSHEQWISVLVDEGDAVAAMGVAAARGDAAMRAMQFEPAVAAFQQALQLCNDPKEPAVKAAQGKRAAAQAAAKGDYSLLSEKERKAVEKALKARADAKAAEAKAADAKAAKSARAAQNAEKKMMAGQATGAGDGKGKAKAKGPRPALANTQAKAHRGGSGRGAGGKKRGRGRRAQAATGGRGGGRPAKRGRPSAAKAAAPAPAPAAEPSPGAADGQSGERDASLAALGRTSPIELLLGSVPGEERNAEDASPAPASATRRANSDAGPAVLDPTSAKRLKSSKAAQGPSEQQDTPPVSPVDSDHTVSPGQLQLKVSCAEEGLRVEELQTKLDVAA